MVDIRGKGRLLEEEGNIGWHYRGQRQGCKKDKESNRGKRKEEEGKVRESKRRSKEKWKELIM